MSTSGVTQKRSAQGDFNSPSKRPKIADAALDLVDQFRANISNIALLPDTPQYGKHLFKFIGAHPDKKECWPQVFSILGLKFREEEHCLELPTCLWELYTPFCQAATRPTLEAIFGKPATEVFLNCLEDCNSQSIPSQEICQQVFLIATLYQIDWLMEECASFWKAHTKVLSAETRVILRDTHVLTLLRCLLASPQPETRFTFNFCEFGSKSALSLKLFLFKCEDCLESLTIAESILEEDALEALGLGLPRCSKLNTLSLAYSTFEEKNALNALIGSLSALPSLTALNLSLAFCSERKKDIEFTAPALKRFMQGTTLKTLSFCELFDPSLQVIFDNLSETSIEKIYLEECTIDEYETAEKIFKISAENRIAFVFEALHTTIDRVFAALHQKYPEASVKRNNTAVEYSLLH